MFILKLSFTVGLLDAIFFPEVSYCTVQYSTGTGRYIYLKTWQTGTSLDQ
jgi:hypothetical protein